MSATNSRNLMMMLSIKSNKFPIPAPTRQVNMLEHWNYKDTMNFFT